jgi:hypothetical protein
MTRNTALTVSPKLSIAHIRIAAYFLLLIGFFLRVFHLDDIAVEKAEMMNTLWFIRDGLPAVLSHNKDLNNHPLNSLLAYLFSWGNETVFTLRWHSVLIGLLAVAAAMRLTRYWYTEMESIIAGLIITLSAHHVTLSQRSRGYVGLVTFTFLSFYFGMRALETGKRRYWLGFVLSSALNAYSHLYGITSTAVTATVLLGWALYQRVTGSNGKNTSLFLSFRRLVLSTLIALVVSLSLYIPMWHDVTSIVAQDNQFRQSDIRKMGDAPASSQILSLIREAIRPFSLADDPTRLRLGDVNIRYGLFDPIAQYAEGRFGFYLSVGAWIAGLLVTIIWHRAQAAILIGWLGLPIVAQLAANAILPGAYYRGRFLGFIFAPYLLSTVPAFAGLGVQASTKLRFTCRRCLYVAWSIGLLGLVIWTMLNLGWLATYYSATITEGWSTVGSHIRNHMHSSDLVVCGQHAKTPCDFDLTVRTFTNVQEIDKLVFETISGNPTYVAIPGRVWLVMPHLTQDQIKALESHIPSERYWIAGTSWGPTGWVLFDRHSTRGENLAEALELGEVLLLTPLDAYRFALSLAELRLTQYQLLEAEAAFAHALALLSIVSPDDKWLPIARQHLSYARQVAKIEAETTFPPTAVHKRLRIGNLAQLIAYEIEPQNPTPGNAVRVTLYWQALRPIERELVSFVHITDRAANILTESSGIPSEGNLPTTRWEPGQIITDTHILTLPRTVATPLIARLDVGLFDFHRNVFIPVFDEAGVPSSSTITQFKVIPTEWPSPHPRHSLDINFDHQINLIGYDWIPETAELVLYWRALATMQKDYNVFVHILNSDEHLVAQADGSPINGNYPTSWWSPGDVVVDRRKVPTLNPGTYKILVGLYDLTDGTRLSRTDKISEEVVEIAPVVIR